MHVKSWNYNKNYIIAVLQFSVYLTLNSSKRLSTQKQKHKLRKTFQKNSTFRKVYDDLFRKLRTLRTTWHKVLFLQKQISQLHGKK